LTNRNVNPGWPRGFSSKLPFDVISTAYDRTSLIVTTNLPFESWTEIPGPERLTGK
jgi:DNA replication protein DnaC